MFCVFVCVTDVNSNPSFGLAAGSVAPLLLILGYVNGIQIWMIPVSVVLQSGLCSQIHIIAIASVSLLMLSSDVCYLSSDTVILSAKIIL